MMHNSVDLKVLYFGTPVVLISTRNEDGTANIAPMSSVWWLGQSAVLGLANTAKTTANLLREGDCVINLVDSPMVGAVDRLALLTGVVDVPAHKVRRGYRYEPDKFAAAGLTRQPSEVVRPPRIKECPIQLECRVAAANPIDGGDATAFEVVVHRAHVHDDFMISGTNYVDPIKWDPLIMKFCEFFGDGRNVYPSQLAEGWGMPRVATASL